MGSSAITLEGAPPVPGTIAFHGWVRRVIADMTTLPARATQYYLSAAGNDSNDGLTTSTAWATTARISTFISGWTSVAGGVQFNAKRGDVFSDTGTITVASAKNHMTFGTYGTGAQPRFTKFKPLTFSASVGGGNTFTFTYSPYTGIISSIQQTPNGDAVDLMPLKRLAGLVGNPIVGGLNVGVENTPGSFYNDTTNHLAYVQPYDSDIHGYNVGGRTWEYCPTNTTPLFSLGDVDDVIIDGWRIEGYGAGFPTVNGNWPIMSTCTGTNTVKVFRCTIIHGDTHLIGNSNGGTGGILVAMGNRLGGTQPNPGDAAGTLLVNYSAGGGQESHFYDNAFLYGHDPSFDQNGVGGTPANLFYGSASGYVMHGGGSSVLMLCVGNYNWPGQFQITTMGGNNNPTTAATPLLSRAFKVGEKFFSRERSQYDPPTNNNSVLSNVTLGGDIFGYTYTVSIGCEYQARCIAYPSSNAYTMASATTGWGIDCVLDVDLIGWRPTITTFPTAYGTFSAAWGANVENCRLSVKAPSPAPWSWGSHAGGDSGSFQNTIFESNLPTGSTVSIGVTNNMANLKSNDYSNNTVTTGAGGYSADATPQVGNYGAIASHPSPGSALYQTGLSPWLTYIIDADAQIQPITGSPHIGPLSQYTAPAGYVAALDNELPIVAPAGTRSDYFAVTSDGTTPATPSSYSITVSKNGTVIGTVPTVTNPSTGLYLYSYSTGASIAGDVFTEMISVVVNGISRSLPKGCLIGTLAADLQTIKGQTVTAATGVTFPAVIGTSTLTGTAQSGDNYARLGAPVGATISADIAAVGSSAGTAVSQTTEAAIQAAAVAALIAQGFTTAQVTLFLSQISTVTGQLSGIPSYYELFRILAGTSQAPNT